MFKTTKDREARIHIYIRCDYIYAVLGIWIGFSKEDNQILLTIIAA